MTIKVSCLPVRDKINSTLNFIHNAIRSNAEHAKKKIFFLLTVIFKNKACKNHFAGWYFYQCLQAVVLLYTLG